MESMRTRSLIGRLLTLGALVALAGVIVVGNGNASGPDPGPAATGNLLPKLCEKPRVEPGLVVFGCADFSTYAKIRKWLEFGGNRAIGTGKMLINNCKPSCEKGKTRKFRRASFVFDKAKKGRCGKRKVSYYRRGTVTYAAGHKPKGHPSSESFRVICHATAVLR